MEERNLVYGLYDKRDGVIRYVGYTVATLRYRVNNHRSAAKSGHPAPVNEWIRSVGLHGYDGKVLEVVSTEKDLKAVAEEWIDHLRGEGVDILNCTEEEHKARTQAGLDDPEVRARISQANLGRTRSEAWRKRISEANKGRVVSPENRAIISATHKGKVLSEETKAKIAAKALGHKRNLGKVHSPEARMKMSITRHRINHTEKGIHKVGCRWCDEVPFTAEELQIFLNITNENR